jgi:hypothetical protein
MSSKNNVNPDHYKVAGRDRPNENLLPEPHFRDGVSAKGGPRPNLIPGAAPVGKASTRGKKTAARGRRKAV